MGVEALFQDIDERQDDGKLAIDADGLLYLSCYRYRNDWDIEIAYMDFIGRVETIKRETYKKVNSLDKTVLCFTAKSNFRYDIYPEYKANRGKNQTEDSKILSERAKELKKMVYSRIKKICKASNIVEADDLVIYYAYKGYLISAIDKDVVNQSPTDCFDFKNFIRNDSLSKEDIEKNMLIQSIQGDTTDNIKGVKGLGAVKAKKFIEELIDGKKTVDDYIDLFESPEDMLLNIRLVDMSQYKSGKLVLKEVQDVFDIICPF